MWRLFGVLLTSAASLQYAHTHTRTYELCVIAEALPGSGWGLGGGCTRPWELQETGGKMSMALQRCGELRVETKAKTNPAGPQGATKASPASLTWVSGFCYTTASFTDIKFSHLRWWITPQDGVLCFNVIWYSLSGGRHAQNKAQNKAKVFIAVSYGQIFYKNVTLIVLFLSDAKSEKRELQTFISADLAKAKAKRSDYRLPSILPLYWNVWFECVSHDVQQSDATPWPMNYSAFKCWMMSCNWHQRCQEKRTWYHKHNTVGLMVVAKISFQKKWPN